MSKGEEVVGHNGIHPLHPSCFNALLINGEHSFCWACRTSFNLGEARSKFLSLKERMLTIHLPKVARAAGYIARNITLPLVIKYGDRFVEMTSRSSDGTWNEPLKVFSSALLTGAAVNVGIEYTLRIGRGMGVPVRTMVKKIYLAATGIIFFSSGAYVTTAFKAKRIPLEFSVFCASLSFGSFMGGLAAKRFHRSFR